MIDTFINAKLKDRVSLSWQIIFWFDKIKFRRVSRRFLGQFILEYGFKWRLQGSEYHNSALSLSMSGQAGISSL